MSDLSIQSKSNNYVDLAKSTTELSAAEKLLFSDVNPTEVVKSGSDSDNINSQLEAVKQQKIEKIIKEAIKGTGLTVEDVMKLFAPLNRADKPLDENVLKNALNCLKYAVEDCTLNGKLDKEKLQKIFSCYVFLTMKPDKRNITCDEARKTMKMSIVQFVVAHNPALKGKKNITAADVKESLKTFVKRSFTKDKITRIKNAPQEAKNAIKSMFGMLYDNCNKDEMNMLVEAFVMLIQDEQMTEYIPVLINEVCTNLKNDKTGKLKQFLSEDLEKILTRLGFEPQTIQKLKQFGLISSINEDNIEEFLTSGLTFLQTIDPKHLTILLESIDVCMNGGELTSEQADILNKYKPQLDNLIAVIGKIANNPELIEKHKELFEKIQNLLQETKLDSYVYSGVKALYEQYPDAFSNCQTVDDLAKVLNRLTGNKFSEAVGDSNPDNLVKLEDQPVKKNDEQTGYKLAPLEVVTDSSERSKAILQTFDVVEEDKSFTIEKVNLTEQHESTRRTEIESLVRKGDIITLKDIFAGKEVVSDFTKLIAVKKFKLKDEATQGEMLLKASGKFFSDLVDNTKSSTLENLLSIGWKGKSFDATKKVKTEVEKRNKDAV